MRSPSLVTVGSHGGSGADLHNSQSNFFTSSRREVYLLVTVAVAKITLRLSRLYASVPPLRLPGPGEALFGRWLEGHGLSGLGTPKGHRGSSMLPVSQQPLQRPPCLPLWAGHRRFEQSSWVHLTRSAVAPQLTHAGSITFISC